MDIKDYKAFFSSSVWQLIKRMKELDNRYASLHKAPFSSPVLQLIKRIKEQEDQKKLINKQLPPFVDVAKTLSISLAPGIEASNSLQASLAPFSKQFLDFRSSSQRALERIQKQTLPMQKDMRQFHLDYLQTHEVFRRIIGVVKSIPREHLAKIHLYSGNWLISDTNLLVEIDKNKHLESDSLTSFIITSFIINYYKVDNWARLEEVIQSWYKIIGKGRTDVFKSALDGTKSKIIIHLLVIQPLISQIEGLLRDLYSILPRIIKKRNENKILDSSSEDIKKKRHYLGIYQIVSSIAESVDPLYAEIIIKVIYKEVFESRDEIMHGDKDFLDYGNEEIFVRLVLYADFIIKFTNQIKTDVLRGRCA